MLVSGRRASRSSSTTSVRVSKAGSILMNWRICPGYHEGGDGSAASTDIFLENWIGFRWCFCEIVPVTESLLVFSGY